ncbi:hypothetical protein [Natronolimnohabitans innermongolicus]|uniref:C2H2-type domain-containing protein n=1 Tax=Natronolimnohabitans innermongolicus JCM 12255 TaxID=1227499 RepID=L9WS04_9EURY|nr:hypothetical protein [Natronolimnohabitans innermongolicus]ELY52255.1 hypothetical protein C493_16444 [Natronolimnohabitans innermongolicus JCM 12255]
MASRPPIECPICRELLARGQPLERHLVASHTKRRLAKFVVAEMQAMSEADVSE